MNPNHTGQGAPFDETLPATEPRIAPTQQQAEVGGEYFVKSDEFKTEIWKRITGSGVSVGVAYSIFNEAEAHKMVAALNASPRPESPEGERQWEHQAQFDILMSQIKWASEILTDSDAKSLLRDECKILLDGFAHAAIPAKGPGPGRSDTERLDWLCDFITAKGYNGLKKLVWSLYDEDGASLNHCKTVTEDEVADLKFDRAAVDRAMPPPASQSNPREHKPSGEQ